jgi:hypothetical protein
MVFVLEMCLIKSLYPDCPSARGRRHIRELIGRRALERNKNSRKTGPVLWGNGNGEVVIEE